MEKLTFNAEEIFEEIPGDPDNVILRSMSLILNSFRVNAINFLKDIDS